MEYLIDIQVQFKDNPEGSPHHLIASINDGEDRYNKN